jgi:hypothetical protein
LSRPATLEDVYVALGAEWLLLGLGIPEWLTIIGLVGGLLLTFRVMARASLRYEEARRRREGGPGRTGKDEP